MSTNMQPINVIAELFMAHRKA